MRPDSKTGGVILEHGRDRRYARAAARRVGSKALKAEVRSDEDHAWSKLFSYKIRRVGRDEIAVARLWGYVLDHKFTEFKTSDGVAEEIARNYANDNVSGEPTELSAENTPALIDGLEAIVAGSGLRAALSLTRQSTAAQMLEDIT